LALAPAFHELFFSMVTNNSTAKLDGACCVLNNLHVSSPESSSKNQPQLVYISNGVPLHLQHAEQLNLSFSLNSWV